MTLDLHAAPLRQSPWRLWGGLGAAVLAWVVAYRVNGPLWQWVVDDLVGVDPNSRWGAALEFFTYDSVKILLLLGGIIFAVTVLRSFMSVERTRSLLGGRREGAGNVAAAGLGVVTPFCSCSAVPGFIGFVAAGVPLGITMSFLIASPMVNEVAIVLLYGLFGWKIAALYVTAGLAVAILAGWVIGRLHLERFVEPFVFENTLRGQPVDLSGPLSWADRFAIGRDEVRTIIRKIWPYLVVGIGIGAAIHGWVPEGFFVQYAGPDNPLAVPVAVGLGIPLYSNAAGILPLVEALHAKGLAMGTVLAFMMSVVALSVPELVLLRRVLKPRLLGVFVGVVGVGILVVGFLFNLIV
ncbi:MAG TPA: permease [Acidimicrobiia bacterium]|nr:permease [Acidimicrobiia bacterium]